MHRRTVLLFAGLLLTACGSRRPLHTPSLAAARHHAPRTPFLFATGPLATMQTLPAWCAGAHRTQVEQLRTLGQHLEAYTLDQIRAAVVEAETQGATRAIPPASKLFLLMRVLFVVPDTAPYRAAPYASSGFFRPMTVPGQPGMYAFGWPLVWQGDRLVEIKPCQGVKSSSIVFHAIREFDAFRERFDRRLRHTPD